MEKPDFYPARRPTFPRRTAAETKKLVAYAAAAVLVAGIAGAAVAWRLTRPVGVYRASLSGPVPHQFEGEAVACLEQWATGPWFEVRMGPRDFKHGMSVGSDRMPRAGARWTVSDTLPRTKDAVLGLPEFEEGGTRYFLDTADGYAFFRRVTPDSVYGGLHLTAQVWKAIGSDSAVQVGVDTMVALFRAPRRDCK